MSAFLKFIGLMLCLAALALLGFSFDSRWFLAYVATAVSIIGLIVIGLGNKKNRTKLGNIAFLIGFVCFMVSFVGLGFAAGCDGLLP